MINFKVKLWASLAIGLMTVAVCAQDRKPVAGQSQADTPHANCPMMKADKASDHGQSHAAHLDEVNARGQHAMGFSQTATTHHFRLSPDGGFIQVETNAPNDTLNRDLIRAHLKHIAGMFSAGNFRIPMLVHDQLPPGVTTMESLKETIRFAFEETASGGRVRISTADLQALAAVHAFLRFQINDHQTGDSLDLSPR